MINVLYIHGYNSSAIKESEKAKTLDAEFNKVYRIAPDYDMGFTHVINEVVDFCNEVGDIDAIIGTSMGGYLAQKIGECSGLPYVSINPAITPKVSLMKYDVPATSLDSYSVYIPSTKGLMIVGLKDDLINPTHSIRIATDAKMPLIIDEDADHRFSDITEHIDEIAKFLYSSTAREGEID